MYGGPQLETLVEGFNITLARKDIQTLKDMTWLNDEVNSFSIYLCSACNWRRSFIGYELRC